jgi:hypothetical protein
LAGVALGNRSPTIGRASPASTRSATITATTGPRRSSSGGVHDPYFDLDEIPAYHRNLPTAESHPLDAGHYLLETHSRECADLMRPFVSRLVRERWLQ